VINRDNILILAHPYMRERKKELLEGNKFANLNTPKAFAHTSQ
jgi:hypothetical protein